MVQVGPPMDCLQWLRGRKSYAFYFTLIVSGISDCLTSSIQMLFILGSLEVVIFALSRGEGAAVVLLH